jgi:O-antigen/teichoic acid export membrane protein
MVLSLQIFAFMGLVRPLAASTSPLFLAVGRPDLNVRVALLLLIVMVAMVLPLLSRGIEGVAFAVVASYTVAFFYSVFEVNRLLPGIARKMAKVILPALFAAAIMVVGVQLSKAPLLGLAGGTHNLITLGLMIAIGAALYISVSLLTQRALILETVSVAIAVFKDRKRKSLQKPLREGT